MFAIQVLATAYKNTKDQWRALGYRKAVASIKQYHKKIETWEVNFLIIASAAKRA